MRTKTFLLLLSLLLLPLSGCLGFGEEKHNHPVCVEDEDDANGGGTNQTGDTSDDNATSAFIITVQHTETCPPLTNPPSNPGNETPEPPTGNETPPVDLPNELPIPMLTMTADDGSILDNFSYIRPGQVVTFSANGTTDPDGNVDLIGLTVTDSNSTRVTQLMFGGQFEDQSFRFDYVGEINVTMRVLDDDGEGVAVYRTPGVNNVEQSSEDVPGFLPAQTGCSPATSSGGQPLIDNNFYHKENFQVVKGAKWFSTSATGTSRVTICNSAGTELATGTAAAETGMQEWSAGSQYFVAFFPSSAQQTINFEIIVHYEDKPAA